MAQNGDTDHEQYIERTLELADGAGERGDGLYGSLLVTSEGVMEETNRERTEDDIACHPELALARRAARELPPEERSQSVMYTSTEPCPMCAGGIAIAGLGGIVYSVSTERAAERFGGATGIPCGEVFERLGNPIDVIGGICEDEGLAVHRTHREPQKSHECE